MFRKRPPTFEALYRDHGARIYRFCFRLTGNPTDAEDLAQEVFVLAYRSLDRFEGRASITTWLYRIALNRWTALRRPNRLDTVPLEEGLDAPTTDPAGASVEKLSLDSAIAALPDPLRESLLLVRVEGLKYREAAEVLGIPQGTVQYRVHEAQQRLRSTLAPEPTPAAETRTETGPTPGPRTLAGCYSLKYRSLEGVDR